MVLRLPVSGVNGGFLGTCRKADLALLFTSSVALRKSVTFQSLGVLIHKIKIMIFLLSCLMILSTESSLQATAPSNAS